MDAIHLLEGNPPRALRLDFNALALYEHLTGRNMLTPQGWRGLAVGDVLTLVWVAAAQLDPGVSVQTIGAELTPDRVPALMEILAEWGAGETEEKPVETADASTQQPPTAGAPADLSPEEASAETARVLAAFGARRNE